VPTAFPDLRSGRKIRPSARSQGSPREKVLPACRSARLASCFDGTSHLHCLLHRQPGARALLLAQVPSSVSTDTQQGGSGPLRSPAAAPAPSGSRRSGSVSS